MKKLFTLFSIIFLAGFAWVAPALALDPVAPREFRSSGMIWVKTPNPTSDKVTITRKSTGFHQTIPSNKIEVVPVGKYQVDVQMGDYHYQQNVLVEPTERTDVEVPGYGNIKVVSPVPAKIHVYKSGTGNLVAKFPSGEIRTLPKGHYDIKIKVGIHTVQKEDIWVVTNTTRVLDVIPAASS